jgi:hypothetical protein
MLAVGLGIGAAVAHAPVASADSSNDWLSSIDTLLSGGTLPALAAPSGLDLAISFNGTSLISDGSAEAYSGTPGDYDLAIAYGANSYAYAGGGFGNYALADGSSDAETDGGPGNFNSAIVVGNGDYDEVGGGNFDNGTIFGNGDDAEAVDGNNDSGTVIGTDSQAYPDLGNFDSAFVIGTDSDADADNGNYDTATILGSNSDARAELGNGDLASVVDTGSTGDSSTAGGFLTAPGPSPDIVLGNNDIASVVGTDSTAIAGSTATTPGDFDLAAVLGDMYNAVATGGNYLVDILPSL